MKEDSRLSRCLLQFVDALVSVCRGEATHFYFLNFFPQKQRQVRAFFFFFQLSGVFFFPSEIRHYIFLLYSCESDADCVSWP